MKQDVAMGNKVKINLQDMTGRIVNIDTGHGDVMRQNAACLPMDKCGHVQDTGYRIHTW